MSDFKGKPLIYKVIVAVVMIALLYFTVRYFQRNPELFSSLKNLTLTHLIICLGLECVVISLLAFKTRLVMIPFCERRPGFGFWLRTYVIGQALNIFAFQSGNVYRAMIAKRHFGLPYNNYGSVFLFISWLDVSVNIAAALLFQLFATQLTQSGLSLGELGLILALWIAIAPLGTFILRFLDRVGAFSKSISDQVVGLLEGFWMPVRNAMMGLSILLLTIVSFSALVTSVAVVFDGLGYVVPWHNAAILLITYRASQVITIVPGNVGIREWSVGGVSFLLGMDAGVGVLLALSLRALRLCGLGAILIASWVGQAGGLLVTRSRKLES